MTKRTCRNLRMPGFKAKVALAAGEGRQDAGRTGSAFRCAPEPRSRNGEARCWKGRLACSARTGARRRQWPSVDLKRARMPRSAFSILENDFLVCVFTKAGLLSARR